MIESIKGMGNNPIVYISFISEISSLLDQAKNPTELDVRTAEIIETVRRTARNIRRREMWRGGKISFSAESCALMWYNLRNLIYIT